MLTSSQPPPSDERFSVEKQMLLAMWAVFLIAAFIFWLDERSILARLLAIIGAGVYLGSALRSGKLYHYKFSHEFSREKSPVLFWSFFTVGIAVLIVLIIDCTEHVFAAWLKV